MQPSTEVIRANVAAALKEDLGSGDVHVALFDDEIFCIGSLDCRSTGVLCGQPWAEESCRQVDERITIKWLRAEGSRISDGDQIATLRGPPGSLLSAERTMINFLQTLSGTATQVRQCVDLIADEKAVLLDTRKTIPGLRVAQKYAVAIGGGTNHRIGLFDAYMIKDNHIVAAGGIRAAVEKAKKLNPNLFLVLEVETQSQLVEALEVGVDRVLLDNYSIDDLAEAVSFVAGRVALEASGGITLGNLREVARTGVDFISVGSLTKSIAPMDISFGLKMA